MMTPTWLRDSVERIENDIRLDRVAAMLDRVAAGLSEGERGARLRGDWLGHALHPLLTDFPLGCWISAGLLDLVGGRRSRGAAQRLVGLGLVFVPVTAAAGAADYHTIDETPARRVGVVHAAGNTVVALCYWKSWRSRGRGRHLRGVVWGLTGGSLAWATGYLGGHLSFGRGVGVGARGFDVGDLVDRQGASALLEVTPDRVDALVDEGLLVAIGPDRFRRNDVLAVKLVGG